MSKPSRRATQSTSYPSVNHEAMQDTASKRETVAAAFEADGGPPARRPHVVLIVPRGEAVRNFLYSDTLPTLSAQARVTLLSVVDDASFRERFEPLVEEIIPLQQHAENRWVTRFRYLVHTAHYRWLWSEVAKNLWEWRDAEARTPAAKMKRGLWKALVYTLANRPTLEALTAAEQRLTWALRPNDDLVELFKAIRPDFVFNGSHIHGEAGELPLKVAHRLGIPTAGFIFSWDNLTSRSRIFPPYDYYLVWNEQMRRQLLDLYPRIAPEHVVVTGTPQFDFHFKPAFWLSREELSRRIGIDPERPFVLYTTGVAQHFPEEHRTVEGVARLLQTLDVQPKPQLVVRTYVKDTSPEMHALAARSLPDVVFPPVLWDEAWFTPRYEDLAIYTSLLRHASLGINAASTVSLELMMHDKPVINLAFDPPGSNLPHHFRYVRHIEFDHYRPVAESGGVMVARSEADMAAMLHQGLTRPEADRDNRARFIRDMFGDTLDGGAGRRVAKTLVSLALSRSAKLS